MAYLFAQCINTAQHNHPEKCNNYIIQLLIITSMTNHNNSDNSDNIHINKGNLNKEIDENPADSLESDSSTSLRNPKRLKESLLQEFGDNIPSGVLPGLNKLKEEHSFPIVDNNPAKLSADDLNIIKTQLVGLMYEYSNRTTSFFVEGDGENLLRGNSAFTMSSVENYYKDILTTDVKNYTNFVLDKIDQLQLSDQELQQIKFADFAKENLPTPPTFYEVRGRENNFHEELAFFPLVDEDLFKNEDGWQGITLDEDIKPIENLLEFKNNLNIYLEHENYLAQEKEGRNSIRPN